MGMMAGRQGMMARWVWGDFGWGMAERKPACTAAVWGPPTHATPSHPCPALLQIRSAGAPPPPPPPPQTTQLPATGPAPAPTVCLSHCLSLSSLGCV